MKSEHSTLEPQLSQAVEGLRQVRLAIEKVIVGQKDVIDLTLLALLSEGHILLEGVPGLGKTMLVRTLAQALHLHFSRLQFTPDLMPSDVIGSTMIGRNNDLDYQLHFEEGPIFANLVLADEINRASPKTQSALLEAMQERSVTVRGKSRPLPRPFMVLATQNPLEMEGTYPLPEAQVDRFAFKILLKHPSHEELLNILDRTMGTESVKVESVMSAQELSVLQQAVRSIQVPTHVAEMAVRLSMLTLPENSDAPDSVKRFVRYGSGPRGAQTLIIAAKSRALLDGRFHASIEDLSQIALAALRHRIALNYDGISEGLNSDTIIHDVLAAIRKGADFDTALQ